MSDYYDELGVSKTATPEEIRSAYRRKAKKLHPDRKGGDAGAMAKANRAYETLVNPQRRLTYDRTGQDAAPPIDQVASNIVVKHVTDWIAAEHNSGDMIGDVSHVLDQKVDECEHQIDVALKVQQRVEKRLKRLKPRKNGAPDFLRQALEHQVEELKRTIERKRDEGKQLKRSIEVLKTYDYEKEKQPPPRQFRPINFGI